MNRDPEVGAEASVSTPALVEVLERAKAVGFLGPGPVVEHVEHASRFDRAMVRIGAATAGPPGSTAADGSGREDGLRFADIGAGGGVPGLVLLLADRRRRAVLIDSSQKRCAFLTWALAELGLADRAEVWRGRAEAIGHQRRARERFDVVVARGFGPPPQTLECATPLVRPGGAVIVSEPPVARAWPVGGLAELALSPADGGPGVAVFERLVGLGELYARPAKELQRRPLFSME